MNRNRQKYNQFHNPRLPVARQQGFVLILVLVLLAVLTLIGVSSMNSSNLELKATANARQHQAAFNAVSSLLEYTVSADPLVLINFQTVPAGVQTVSDYTPRGLFFAGGDGHLCWMRSQRWQ